MLNAFASLKCSKNASIMYKSLTPSPWAISILHQMTSGCLASQHWRLALNNMHNFVIAYDQLKKQCGLKSTNHNIIIMLKGFLGNAFVLYTGPC